MAPKILPKNRVVHVFSQVPKEFHPQESVKGVKEAFFTSFYHVGGWNKENFQVATAAPSIPQKMLLKGNIKGFQVS